MTAPYWTPDRVAVLLSIIGKGGSYADVAAAVGCPKNSVASKISRLRELNDPRLPPAARHPDRRYQRNMTGKTGPRISAVPIAVQGAPAPIAPRDPCFRCGVRRDVGCEHTAWEQAA